MLLDVFIPTLEEEEQSVLKFVLEAIDQLKEVGSSLDANGKIFFVLMKHYCFLKSRGKITGPMPMKHFLFAFHSQSQVCSLFD